MRLWIIALFAVSGIFAACTAASPTNSPINEVSPTHSPLQTITVPPSEVVLPTLTPASEQTQSASDYCEQLLDNYQRADGFQTYCDADYGFALDYPSTWRKTIVAQWPDIASMPSAVRRELSFDPGDMSNYIRTSTYHMYGNLTLRERVEYSLGYNDRAFPDKSYSSLVLGGYKAYVIMQCRWGQAYSSVDLYLHHGQYYTIMELMAINRIGLDTNWQIARSIQTTGFTPDNNVIPHELIDDSYKLVDCHVPPTAQPGTEPTGTTTRTPTPTSTLPTDTAVRLAFVSNMDGETALYRIITDDSALTRLTNQPMLIMHPTWSPDGGRIAFEACRGGDISTDCPERESFDIYTVNADGTSLTNLTPNPAMDRFPSWSPDGKIAFSSDRSGKDEIYVMNADGTALKQISGGQDRNDEPHWSPDRKWLAYHCTEESTTSICITPAGSPDQVIQNAGTSPVWSPINAEGGLRLAFHCWSTDQSDICTVKPDGSDLVNLTNSPEDEIDPTWSPDGHWIAYQSNRENEISIYKVCMTCEDSAEPIRLTTGETNTNWPIWSPDGNWIAYMADNELYVMLADGSGQRLLAGGVSGPAAWAGQ